MLPKFRLICVFLFSLTQFTNCISIRSECGSSNRQNADDDKLIFAHTLCRHGDRNAYVFFPNDPWKSEENWPGGYAQLTKTGKLQSYALGKFFRKRYASLIGNGDYSPKKIYVQSSDVDRVLMTAETALAGLLPPNNEQVWSKNLNWQPIPVHSQPQVQDNTLAGDKRCDRFDYVMLQYMNANGSEYKEHFKRYASVITDLELNSGMKLPTITDIANLYDALLVERLKNKRLPTWAETAMQSDGDLEKLAFYWFRMFTATNEMKKYRSGYLLKEILDHFKNKTLSQLSPNRSLWMYFAHDITLSNMLNSLGVFNLRQPPLASCILFELYEGCEGPYVQIFYRNTTAKNIPPLNIPNCGVKCPLKKLYDLYDEILPKQDFDDACALRLGESLPPGGNPENNAL